MSTHLVQSGIANLLTMFPDRGFEQAEIDRYNRIARFEWERIRDFLVLHYNAAERDDSAFWNDCRTMSIPDCLADKIALFKAAAIARRRRRVRASAPFVVSAPIRC